jgi:serine protease Do
MVSKAKGQSLLNTKTSRNALMAAALGGAVLSGLFFSGAIANAQPPRLLTPPSMYDGQLSFADLVERVSPAVVSIHTEKNVKVASLPPALEDRYRFRFGGDGFEEQFPQERRSVAEGSGFFVDGDGHVVTNNHVIAGAEKITVRLNDGRELEAEVVGIDPGTDLAVLKVDADRSQPFVRFADDVELRVGDWVLAVGNPFGLGGTVTSGIVSALGRDNYAPGNYSDYIQIDAPINRGNSGGPTFDLQGRVVGVNTAIYSPTGGSVGIGFAIPASTASNVVQQIIENGSVSRGWLGVSIRDVDNNLAMAMDLESTKGALVADVMTGTPAAKAGFQSGDVVLLFDGKEVDSARALTRLVGSIEPGQNVKVQVARDGTLKDFTVKLGERSSDEESTDISGNGKGTKNSTLDELGVRFGELDDDMRERLDIEDDVKGVVVTAVRTGSPADEAGLSRGTIILKADNQAIEQEGDLKTIIEKAKEEGREAILLRVQIGNRKDFRALPLEKN